MYLSSLYDRLLQVFKQIELRGMVGGVESDVVILGVEQTHLNTGPNTQTFRHTLKYTQLAQHNNFH